MEKCRNIGRKYMVIKPDFIKISSRNLAENNPSVPAKLRFYGLESRFGQH